MTVAGADNRQRLGKPYGPYRAIPSEVKMVGWLSGDYDGMRARGTFRTP